MRASTLTTLLASGLLLACEPATGPAGPPGPAPVLVTGSGVAGDGSTGNPLRLDLAAASSQCSGAADAGRVRYDGTGGRLQVCDGVGMVDVGICSAGGGCSAPEFVPCGTPVLDSCGNACGGLTGTACTGGAVCSGGGCIGPLPRSCFEILSADGAAGSNNYTIDPDGPGGHPPVQVYCDMGAGGFTLVLNVYDTVGDDAPNTPDWVESGWEQPSSGRFVSPVTQVRKTFGTGASSALPPTLISAMWREGQSHLKFCLVGINDASELCKGTLDGSLTLTAAPTTALAFASRALGAYVRGSKGCPSNGACDAAYTFGRLAGLPGSRNDYVAQGLGSTATPTFCIPNTAGLANEFGTGTEGACEYPTGAANWAGVWHNWGSGISYRPWLANDDEIGNAVGPNPAGTNLTPTGFRIWVK